MAEEDESRSMNSSVPDLFATPHRKHSGKRRHSRHRGEHRSSRGLLADRDNGAFSADEQDRPDDISSEMSVSSTLDLHLDTSFRSASNSATSSPSSVKSSGESDHHLSPIITVNAAPVPINVTPPSSLRGGRHRSSRSIAGSVKLAVEDPLANNRVVTSEGESDDDLLVSSEPMPPPRLANSENGWNFTMKSCEVQVDSKMQPVAVYTMDVEHDGRRWTIARRFNNFYQLDISLEYTFGSKMHLPNLPRKKFFKRGSDPYIMRERRKLLQQYLSDLCRLEVVVKSDLFQEWVQGFQSFYPLVPPDKCGILTQQRSLRVERKYYFSVKGPLFVVYKDIASPPTAFDTPNGVFWIGGSTTKEGTEKTKFTFVTHSGKVFSLEAATEEEAESWIALLRKVAAMLPVTPVSSPAVESLPAPMRPWLFPAAGMRKDPEKPQQHSPLLREQSPPSSLSPRSTVNSRVFGGPSTPRSSTITTKGPPSPGRSETTTPSYRSRRRDSVTEINNSSLEELMRMPPSPALKPRNGPFLPGSAYFSSTEYELSDRVREEKRKADIELRSISFSLQNEIQQAAKNGKPSPVGQQIMTLVDQLLETTAEELSETDDCREVIAKLQNLSFHPVSSRVIYLLAPLARAIMAEQISREEAMQDRVSDGNISASLLIWYSVWNRFTCSFNVSACEFSHSYSTVAFAFI